MEMNPRRLPLIGLLVLPATTITFAEQPTSSTKSLTYKKIKQVELRPSYASPPRPAHAAVILRGITGGFSSRRPGGFPLRTTAWAWLNSSVAAPWSTSAESAAHRESGPRANQEGAGGGEAAQYRRV